MTQFKFFLQPLYENNLAPMIYATFKELYNKKQLNTQGTERKMQFYGTMANL